MLGLPLPRNGACETIHNAVHIGKKAGLEYIYTGNIPGDKHENTYCPYCNNIIIERFGYMAHNHLKEGNKCNKCGKKINLIT